MRATLTPTALNLAFQTVSLHMVRGFRAGIQGDSFVPPAEAPTSADPTPREWGAFLRRVRAKDLNSRGRLNDGAEACADAFLAGALEVFPEARTKVFLKTLRRVWGVRMSPTKSPLALPVSRERLKFSREVGRHGGERLRVDYEAGRLAGLGKTVLDHKLHLRNVGDYLEASGWLLGRVTLLKDPFAERSELLARNHASVVHRAFHSGNVRYPAEAVEALPSMLQILDLAIARWETSDPDAAQALRSNRDSVINRSLHGGDLNYPAAVVEALPRMLQTWDQAIAGWESSDPETARILRSNRASVISRALNVGNLNYPEEAVKRLPSLLRTLDAGIARLARSDAETSRILRDNRSNVVTRVLATGDFQYADEVVKTLPRICRTLDQEIARLKRSDAEAARLLQNNRPSVISRALNRDDWKYPRQVAKALPSLLQALDREIDRLMVSDPETARVLKANHDSVIHRAIGNGELNYVNAVITALSKKPGLLAEIRKELRRIRDDHPEWRGFLDGVEPLILGKAFREGLLDAASACRIYMKNLLPTQNPST